MSDFVWVRDTLTGKSGPISTALAELQPGRYKPNPKHPTRNSRGDLLAWKEPIKAAKATEAAKGATK